MNSRIVINPNLFDGKPFVRGANIPVHLILDLLSAGSSLNSIIAKYPRLTEDDIHAVIEYAFARTRDDLMKPSEPLEPPPDQSMRHAFPRIPTRLPESKQPLPEQTSETKLQQDHPVESKEGKQKFSSKPLDSKRPTTGRLQNPKLPTTRSLESKPVPTPRQEGERLPIFSSKEISETEVKISAWNRCVRILNQIGTFLFLITKTVLALLTLILFGAIVYFLLNQETTIILLPFESGIGFEPSQNIGERIVNQLVSELERIEHLQTFPTTWEDTLVENLLEEKTVSLPPATEPIEVTFKKGESLKIGSFKVSIYPALLTIQKLWNRESTVLSGNIQKFGPSYFLTASLGRENAMSATEEDLEVYPPASEPQSPEEKIQKLIRILAYKLAFATSDMSARSEEGTAPYRSTRGNDWKSYFYFSEALGAYQKFLSNPKTYLKDWENALSDFQKSLTLQRANPKTYFNLGLVHQALVENLNLEDPEKSEHLSKAIEAYRETIKLQPNFSDVYYHLAMLYLKQKDYSHAASSLNKALELNQETVIPQKPGLVDRVRNVLKLDYTPKFSNKFAILALLHAKLGETYVLAGKYEEAKGIYQDLLATAEKVSKSGTTYPLEIPAYYGMARVYMVSQDFNAAVREYNKILKLNPQPSLITLARQSIGQIYVQQNKYQEALFEYQEALRLNPEDANSYLGLSSVHLLSGQNSEALAALKEAIRINPPYAEAYKALGDVYFKQNKTFDAIEAYKQALQIKPEYPEALNKLGLVYAKQQANTEAIQYYQKALRIDPKFPGARTNLGLIYSRSGKYSEAISEFIQVLQENPADIWAHLGIGIIHAKQGHHLEAEAKYMEALHIDPDFAPAHNYLGQLYADQKKFSEALTEYEKALKLDPTYAEAYANLGTTYAEMERYEEALSELKKALSLNDKLPEAQIGLGKVFTKQASIPEAITAYQQALRLDQRNTEALYGLGLLLLSQGKIPEATIKFQQTLEINPNLLNAHLSLARIYLQQGNNEKATEEFKKVLKLDPGNVEASQGIEQVEQE
jgi:tetratricopeptide (TPR) repeat protein/uncharacterized protein (DUF433 family)